MNGVKPSKEEGKEKIETNEISRAQMSVSISSQKVSEGCPEESANFISKLTLWWLNPLISLGRQRFLSGDSIHFSDLWAIPKNIRANISYKNFESEWKKTLHNFKDKKKNHNLFLLKILFRTHWSSICISIFLAFIQQCLLFSGPTLLNRIVSFIAGRSTISLAQAYLFASCLFIAPFLGTLCFILATQTLIKTQVAVRGELISAIYRKALKLSNNSRLSQDTGKIINLQAVDVQQVVFFLNPFLLMLFTAPITIVIALILIFFQLRIATLVGIATLVIFLPLNSFLIRKLTKLRRKQLKQMDARVKLQNEVLSGIRVVKLYAWEDALMEKILGVRNKEIDCLKSAAYYRACVSSFLFVLPLLVAVSSFVSYVIINKSISPPKAFTALALFNILRFPLAFLPFSLSQAIQASVALKRLSIFLSSPEVLTQKISKITNLSSEEDSNFVFQIHSGNFFWSEENDSTPILKNINLKIARGKLTAIIGSVASGKSSLLSSLLGEMVPSSETQLLIQLQQNFSNNNNDNNDNNNNNESTDNYKIGEINLSEIAYVSQQAWIVNDTLRNNILMGQPLDMDWYNQVLDACCLRDDLKIMPADDLTEIGEKGINISGGQKQRVSLARALYCKSQVVLLDDPLSAVDPHVGKSIFENCILKRMKNVGRSVVLVTNQIQYLNSADHVILLDEGRVIEQGSYEKLRSAGGNVQELLLKVGESTENKSIEKENDLKIQNDLDNANESNIEEDKNIHYINDTINDNKNEKDDQDQANRKRIQNSIDINDNNDDNNNSNSYSNNNNNVNHELIQIDELSKNRKDHVNANNDTVNKKTNAINKKERNKKSRMIKIKLKSKKAKIEEKKKGQLIEIEGRSKGKLSLSVILTYTKFLGGYSFIFLILFIYTMEQSTRIGTDYWLALFSGGNLKKWLNLTLFSSMLIYCIWALSNAVVIYFRSLAISLGGLKAAKGLHEALLKNVLKLPVLFFDVNPLGRVLNRFSTDTDSIDYMLAQNWQQLLTCLTRLIASCILLAVIFPYFLAALIPASIIYFVLYRYYSSTSRDLQRLDAVSRSPIYATFSEALQGISTIRAYNYGPSLISQNEDRLDHNHAAFYAYQTGAQWLGFRLEVLGELLVCFVGILAVSQYKSLRSNPGLAGLALSEALDLLQFLNRMIRFAADVESKMNAVERVADYSSAETENENLTPGKNVASDWPQNGLIEINNLVLRYRPELSPALKGISVCFKPKEKIGVVGRTGSGKSSLMLALFRIVEYEEGSILIDGVDIKKISLNALRSRLCIIPQDPVIFSGTLRSNLDPFAQHSDTKLWDAIELSGFKSSINAWKEKLDYAIKEGGENLSVGTRQLICLARAILKFPKILIMDEATASVDIETDIAIQKCVRKQFLNSTVLTIAHRLNTVMDSDKILLLSHGKVAEFSSPSSLLDDSNSALSMMVDQMGNMNAAHLRKVARGEQTIFENA